MTEPAVKQRRMPTFVRTVLLPMLLGAIITTIVAAIVYVPRAGWTTGDVTTGSTPGYPDIQSRRYDSSPVNTLQYASAAAAGIKGWKVVRRDEGALTLQVEVHGVIPFATDDLTVTVVPTGANNDSSEVVIRSRSRSGKADLGENARHIRALQKEMDERLAPLP